MSSTIDAPGEHRSIISRPASGAPAFTAHDRRL
jgi:hypothetical protein